VIEHLATSTAFRAFARRGEYIPPGEDPEAVEVSVIVDLAIEAYDEYGRLLADVDVADFLHPASVEKGGRLTVEGYDDVEWELLARLSDDGEAVRYKIDRIIPEPEEPEPEPDP
jgi:hypothetical protein